MPRPSVTAAALLLGAAATAGCGDDTGATTTARTPPPTPPSGLVTRVVDGDLDTPIVGATVAAWDNVGQLAPSGSTDAQGRWTLPQGATLSYARVPGREPGYAYIATGRVDEVIVRLYDPDLQNPEVGGGPTRRRVVRKIALAAPRGEPTWRLRTGQSLGAPPAVSNGVAVLVDTGGQMVAVGTRLGRVRWRAQIGSTGRGAMTTPTIIQQERRVLVSSGDHGLGSYDLTNGNLQRSFGTGDNALTTPPLVTADGIFVGSATGRIYRLDRDQLTLRCSYPATAAIVGTPALSPAGVVFADAAGAVTTIDPATCEERWRVATGAPLADGPAVAGGRVVVGNSAGLVIALDQQTGRTTWRSSSAGAISAAPAITKSTVFIGNRGGTFDALDLASGSRRWQFDADGPVLGSATIVGQNVYFTAGQGSGTRVVGLRIADGARAWRRPGGTRTAVVAAGRTLFVNTTRELQAYRAP